MTLICSNCGSLNIRKDGHTKKGNQRYLCKDCGQRHTLNPKRIKITNMVCPACGSTDIGRRGATRNGNKRYLCKTCHKSFVGVIIGSKKVMTKKEKEFVLRYHLGCGVPVIDIAKHLHYGKSRIYEFLKERKNGCKS